MIPEHDTEDWRILRDAKLMEWIGDESAVRAIGLLGDISETWDDLVDSDKAVPTDRIDRAFQQAVVDLPLNAFWRAHNLQLVPILIAGINAWRDANALEHGDDNDKALAYALRTWYIELVSYVIWLARGDDYLRKVSLDVRRFFLHGETLEAYKAALP